MLVLQTRTGSNRFTPMLKKKIMSQKKNRQKTVKYDAGMTVYSGLGELINRGEPRPFPESYFLPDNNRKPIFRFWQSDVKMYDYILFDFDGTLVDSSFCSVIATQKAFEKMALTAPSPSEITDKMGIPIEKSFQDLGAARLSDDEFHHLLCLFRELYRENGDSHITVFSGVVDLLEELKNSGKKIAIITSKKTEVAARNAASHHLTQYVDLIVGSDKVSHYKPHPEGIFKAMHYFGAKTEKSSRFIMVGDAVTDIAMGKAANVSTCAVTWGAHSMEKLASANPDYITDNFISLINILNGKKITCPFSH